MAKFTFDGKAVKELFEHSKSNPEHSPSFEHLCDARYLKDGEKMPASGFAKVEQIDTAKIPPHLLLVKDQGLYLMSGSKVRLAGDETANKVVYAKGYGAECDYEKLRTAAGGDDFAEAIDIEWLRKAIEQNAKTISITLTRSQIKLGWTI